VAGRWAPAVGEAEEEIYGRQKELGLRAAQGEPKRQAKALR